MHLTIPGTPRSKKNSQRVIMVGGRPRIIPSKAYVDYEKACEEFMPTVPLLIDFPVNVKCVYYMPTRRLVDMVNLQEASLDVLVKYMVLKDDNARIVASMDGSRVLYDKDNPRVEIEITAAEEGEQCEQ